MFAAEADVQNEFQICCKKMTGDYHDQLVEMPKAHRRKCAPPFILVIDGMLVTAVKVAEHLPEDDSLRRVFKVYPAELLNLTPEDKVNRLLADWRYACWRNTHLRTRANFEVAISPVASPIAGKDMTAFMKISKLKAGGEIKSGAALKTAIELRLEQAMRSLGV